MKAWWKLFAAADLDELVARVTDSNLEVREMSARVAAAQALEHAARTEFQPSIQAATNPVETPDTRGAYLQAGVEAAWPLGLFGRQEGATAAAKADAEMARADVELARARAVAETVRAYVELRAARAAALNLDARIAAQAEQTELMRARVRLRLSAPGELATEEARQSDLQSERLSIDRRVTEESERLGLLTATSDPYHSLTVADALPSLPSPPAVDSIPADLLRNRADVRHAEQAAMKAVAQLNLAKADLYPQLTLAGSITVGVPIAGVANGATQALATVAPVIDIPLFDWGRRKAVVLARDSMLEATLLAYRQSILAGVHEVEAALGTLDSVTRDVELRRASLERAQRAQETTTTAARLGRASRMDVLTSILARLEATGSLASAERSRSLAYVELCQALSGARPLPST